MGSSEFWKPTSFQRIPEKIGIEYHGGHHYEAIVLGIKMLILKNVKNSIKENRIYISIVLGEIELASICIYEHNLLFHLPTKLHSLFMQKNAPDLSKEK